MRTRPGDAFHGGASRVVNDGGKAPVSTSTAGSTSTSSTAPTSAAGRDGEAGRVVLGGRHAVVEDEDLEHVVGLRAPSDVECERVRGHAGGDPGLEEEEGAELPAEEEDTRPQLVGRLGDLDRPRGPTLLRFQPQRLQPIHDDCAAGPNELV